MFITSEIYLEHIRALIKANRNLSMAVAFWGTGARTLFENGVHKQLRIICNLESGATNPDEIAALMKCEGFQIRTHRKLHAKVILGSHSAIVGSANMSSNGLSLEDSEVGGWEEGGIETKDTSTLSEMRDWFESMWVLSRDVVIADIEAARPLWNARHGSRILRDPMVDSDDPFNWLIKNWRSFEGRPISVVIYRNRNASSEAKKAEENWKTAEENPFKDFQVGSYEYFDSLPPKDDLIDIYYGTRGAVQSDGIWQKIAEAEKASGGKIQIVKKLDYLESLSTVMGGMRIETTVIAKFVDERIKPNIEKIWRACPLPPEGEDGRKISLYEVMKLLFEG